MSLRDWDRKVEKRLDIDKHECLLGLLEEHFTPEEIIQAGFLEHDEDTIDTMIRYWEDDDSED